MLSRRSISQLLHRLSVCNQANLHRNASSLCTYRPTVFASQWATIGSTQCFKPPTTAVHHQIRHLSSGEPNPPPKSSQDGEETDDDDLDVPLLMDFMPRGMPNLWYSIKNFYILNFILRGQIDKSFDIKVFIEGARQALVTVSTSLANNQLDNLTGLVEKEALAEIKENYKRLNMSQRKDLQLIKSDIVLSFTHHVRIETLKEDFTGTHKHIVYMFIVFDCVRNLEEILKEKAAQRQRGNARELFREFHDKKWICNYEFKREYIEGGQCSDWTISKLMHIKERDLVTLYRR